VSRENCLLHPNTKVYFFKRPIKFVSKVIVLRPRFYPQKVGINEKGVIKIANKPAKGH
jgi:hypothetical protein